MRGKRVLLLYTFLAHRKRRDFVKWSIAHDPLSISRVLRLMRGLLTSDECQAPRRPSSSERGFGIVEITEDLPRPFEKHPAGVGRRDVPCRA